MLRGKVFDNTLLKIGRKGDQLTFTTSGGKGKKEDKELIESKDA